MGTVHWLSPEEQGDWDAFVIRHPLGLVYHLSGWQRVLETAFGHIRGRFLALKDESGRIQAGLPVYTVKSWLLKDRTVSVPFATMCDPLIASKEQFDQLWPAIEDTSGKERSRRIEIRTKSISPTWIPGQLMPSLKYKHHYLPLDKNPDALFRSFHDSCVRRRVQKAKRSGVVVEERKDDESLRVFHTLACATRTRHSLPPMPFAFFQAMYRCLSPNHAALYFALHEGKPVAGILALKCKDMWTLEYSGEAENATAGANQLLCWDTIQRARSSGAAFYSFGRTALDNESLIDHKRRWATVEEDLTDFVSVPGSRAAQVRESPKALDLAIRAMGKSLLRHAPAPVLKSFGDFCYRHLG